MAVDPVGIAMEVSHILSEIIQRCKQRKENIPLSQELQGFVQDLQTNTAELRMKAIDTCSDSATCALDALGEDLERANADAKDILQKGFILSIWRAKTTLSNIQALHKRVMTSFQTRLLFVTLDVAIGGGKKLDDFKAFQLNINENLKKMYSTQHKSIEDLLRSELKGALQPTIEAMEKNEERIKAATLVVQNTKAQTDEAEKFFADVLAELEQIPMANVKSGFDGGSSSDASRMEASASAQAIMEWFEDPITSELMCDPVKAVDGHTYDRWTIIRAVPFPRSPFSPGQAFAIAADDIDVRSRLLARYPDQEMKFHSKRVAYREAALEEANKGHFGDAVSMLGHVLQWDPDDKECRERRDQALLGMADVDAESILKAGQSLQAGASLCKGNYELIMQQDDNLVIYCNVKKGGDARQFATWTSKTYTRTERKGECYVTMETNGNLVIYRGVADKEVIWASNSEDDQMLSSSSEAGDYALHLTETGILEIRKGALRHWCSEPMKTLMAGESLKAGSFLLNGAYKLSMQRDDNLVLYHMKDIEKDHVVWTSKSQNLADGEGRCRLVMQHDGNLVINDEAAGKGVIWMSNSKRREQCDYLLHLRSDGYVVIRSPNERIVWSIRSPNERLNIER